MKYVSTRGQSPARSFEDILLAGLAPDGGLYMPELWPQSPLAEFGRSAAGAYVDAALAVISRFAGDDFPQSELSRDIADAYSGFDVEEIAPLVPLRDNIFVLELFHGPTLAFKDLAMQVLGRLVARALSRRGGRATILAATSGDTGSAAIAAFRDLPNVQVFVLFPHQRVSEVQRRQMTTSQASNVHTVAIEGTFDDAQAIVKALFADGEFAARHHLTAVNSINLVRIIAQSVYYFTALAKLGTAASFVVPTGNFGDVFAGEAAARMGASIRKLIVATNANDIMVRALNDGVYAVGNVTATLSPSMDIQVASNFERALFEASGRDSAWLREAMAVFSATRHLKLPRAVLESLIARYAAFAVDDQQTLATIAAIRHDTGDLIDPHTAVAVAAAEKFSQSSQDPVVVLSTAHPAKFPDAVRRAVGLAPPLPPRLADLYDRPEQVSVLPAETGRIRAFIADRLAGT